MRKIYKNPYLGHIILVEDDELLGLKLQSDLKKENIQFTFFADVESAKSEVLNAKHHALVTDMYLNSASPNGLELIKLAAQMGLPSVMITSQLDLNVAKEGLNSGADYVLEKPFKMAELRKILEDLWENPRGLIGRRERCFDRCGLTPKEREFSRLILKGLSNKEIAEVVDSTVGTVKVYSNQIFQKFDVKSRGELFNFIFPT